MGIREDFLQGTPGPINQLRGTTVAEVFNAAGGEPAMFTNANIAAAHFTALKNSQLAGKFKRGGLLFGILFTVSTALFHGVIGSRTADARQKEIDAKERTLAANQDSAEIESRIKPDPAFQELDKKMEIVRKTEGWVEEGYLTLFKPNDLHFPPKLRSRNVGYQLFNQDLKAGKIDKSFYIKIPKGSPLKARADGTYYLPARANARQP